VNEPIISSVIFWIFKASSYISSIIENYFRDLYVALIIGSEKKEKILQDARINSNDFLDISENRICIILLNLQK